MTGSDSKRPPFAVEKPTLIVDKEKACRNIRTIVEKARAGGVVYRPHFKTHHSADIGEWYRNEGVNAITVSSVDMAKYFADNGWKDITIAFPVNLLQIKDINDLAQKISLNLLVESIESVDFLAKNLKNKVEVWIEIDTGYHRSGIAWNNYDKISATAKIIDRADNLGFEGILTHSGHSYELRSKKKIGELYRDTIEKMTAVRDSVQSNRSKNIKISVGDTPCCSITEDFSEVDEIRPGNLLFYDVMQAEIGSCSISDIAVAVACPVVAIYEERNEIIIYGGGVHLSKERCTDGQGVTHYGRITFWEGRNWGEALSGSYVMSLSQEHGIIKADPKTVKSLSRGDLVFILPVHSCLTTDLLRNYITTDGTKLNSAGY